MTLMLAIIHAVLLLGAIVIGCLFFLTIIAISGLILEVIRWLFTDDDEESC